MQNLIAQWRQEADDFHHANVKTERGIGIAETLKLCAQQLEQEYHDHHHDEGFISGCTPCDVEYQTILRDPWGIEGCD